MEVNNNFQAYRSWSVSCLFLLTSWSWKYSHQPVMDKTVSILDSWYISRKCWYCKKGYLSANIFGKILYLPWHITSKESGSVLCILRPDFTYVYKLNYQYSINESDTMGKLDAFQKSTTKMVTRNSYSSSKDAGVKLLVKISFRKKKDFLLHINCIYFHKKITMHLFCQKLWFPQNVTV